MRIVETGTLSAAADDLRVAQSTVSKWLVALEDELGVRLLDRTTRHRRVTASGERFYARATEILAAYAEVSAELQEGSPQATGRLRVSVPVVFGRLYVAPLVAKFLRKHSGLDVELLCSDRYVDLTAEGVDVAIRTGRAVDSSYRARHLGQTPRRLVASPGYVSRAGRPPSPAALRQHDCLRHTTVSTPQVWTFTRGGRTTRAEVRGRAAANNSDALLVLAKAGLGIALLASWLVDADLRAGRLVTLLDDYEAPPAPITALMLAGPDRQPHPRVRLFVDAMREGLAERIAGS